MLEKYKSIKSLYHCPQCDKRTFTRYINTNTGEYIHPTVGKCSRLNNCTYHYPPRQYFQENNIKVDYVPVNYVFKAKLAKAPPTSYIPFEVLKSSLNNLSSNNFISFLESRFGIIITKSLISQNFIGFSDKWDGATVFWQVDKYGKIRTGEILLLDSISGKTIKQPFRHKYWVHCHLKLDNYILKQCFYGEHLLYGNTKPVAIVESAKTAIIASVYYPEYVWLATMGINGLNVEKCKVLKGRAVTLFPDLNGYDYWKKKQKEISQNLPTINFTYVSDIIEKIANDNERKEGLDLADYLLRFDYPDFLNNNK